MRGDRPVHEPLTLAPHPFTPHARGSTFNTIVFIFHSPVYPACAGIDLCQVKFLLSRLGLPRMRGDRPLASYKLPA